MPTVAAEQSNNYHDDVPQFTIYTKSGRSGTATPRHRPSPSLGGGTDLLLDLHRGGPDSAVTVVDLTAISELRGIDVSETTIRIMAATTHNEVVQHPGLRKQALPLVRACLEIGSPQLRNRATLAGNLATASPVNDSISARLATIATLIRRALHSIRDAHTAQILPASPPCLGTHQRPSRH